MKHEQMRFMFIGPLHRLIYDLENIERNLLKVGAQNMRAGTMVVDNAYTTTCIEWDQPVKEPGKLSIIKDAVPDVDPFVKEFQDYLRLRKLFEPLVRALEKEHDHDR